MSLRGPATQHLHNEARSAEFDGTGGTEIKSVLEFSSYFVGIQIRYIPTYIDSKKLSPKFSWVSKFDVKLGVGEQNLKTHVNMVISKMRLPLPQLDIKF